MTGSGVPAAPNQSRLRGRLTSVSPGPEASQVWQVQAETSEAVGGLADFVAARIGGPIEVIVPPGGPSFAPPARIEARVSFQGDERGGAFFLLDQDARLL